MMVLLKYYIFHPSIGIKNETSKYRVSRYRELITISSSLGKSNIFTNVYLFYKLFVLIFRKSYSSSGRRKLKKNKKFVIEDELSETETTKVSKKKRQRKVRG